MFSIAPTLLTLIIADRVVQFRTVEDFEFALNGRTSIPANKINYLVSMSDHELLREAEGIRELESHFAEILSASLGTSKEVGPILQSLDMSLVTQDNDWRLIIEALNNTGKEFETYKRTVLVKYMQYLETRQDVIKILYSKRQLDRATAATATQTLGTEDSQQLTRETLTFDIPQTIETGHEWHRLPKGETIDVIVVIDSVLPLRLATQPSKVCNENGTFVFEYRTGFKTQLSPGQYVVGRDEACRIKLNPQQQDISRHHLIIEVTKAGILRLTDISSLGTFVPPGYMPS